MKRQLQGIALILFSILLTIAYGNVSVFDLSFRWSEIFTIVGIYGLLLTFFGSSKDKKTSAVLFKGYKRMKLFYTRAAALLLLTALVLLAFSGCKSEGHADFPEYTVVDNVELGCVELHRDGIVYRPYGNFYNDGFNGEQIGVREGDSESKICEVKGGYNSDEWIVECSDAFMEGGNMLFKAVTVTEIPAELAEFKSYDY
jgi:hypothetical protein